MTRIKALGISALTVLLLSACAPAVPVQSTQLTPFDTTRQHERVRVAKSVSIWLSTGFSRKVNAGTVWRPIGDLPQGLVLRPVNGVFTIEGRQVHEADLVVKENQLVGFYLPGESHFSALQPSQPITIEKIND
ncbi:hypothetical protein P3T18_006097 [Paraburkholderia sp. GAS199]|uniref:hypothetical protein n=1 Tax=Paraburkholderia sp. GAS199 TaxID=3035126 RepID=UPI003D214904